MRINCSSCPSLNFDKFSQLRNHLECVHDITNEFEKKEFDSFNEFKEWRLNEEKISKYCYIQDTAPKRRIDGMRYYFLCHRSFKERKSGKNIRNEKSLRTNKIGAACPSAMTATVMENGKVLVEFWKTHYGHEAEIGRQKLQENDRLKLAENLRQGVPINRVLKDIRNGAQNSTELSRIDMIEAKDLQNIIRDYKITYSTRKHENDAVSVKLWVNENNNTEDSPVLYFKEQNTEDCNGILQEQDFCLIVMTTYQKIMLEKFAGKKVLIDGTHGMNNYNFQLYTLLTIDEFNNGCPLAYMFSNREDETVFELYFNEIKKVGGIISAEIFMSDDAPAFYNAWQKVMGSAIHRLLCSWHIGKNWRQNLNKIGGKDKEKAKMVYKALRVLLIEPDKTKFLSLMKETIEKLLADEDTASYGEYFKRHYSHRPEMWAYCFRKRLGLNTNNHIESMHKKLKYCYLDGKKVRRMDVAVEAIMELTRNCYYQRLIKLMKHVKPSNIKKIECSHLKAETEIETGKAKIEKICERKWEIQSFQKNDIKYSVEKNNEQCTDSSCLLKCKKCKPTICVHSYVCTCRDNYLNFNICKHIHAIHAFHSNENVVGQNKENLDFIDYPDSRDQEMIELMVSVKPLTTKPNTEKDKLLSKMKVISSIIASSEYPDKDLEKMIKNVDLLLAIASSKRKFSEEKNMNVKAKIDRQVNFFSTRKKRKSAEEGFKHPTSNQEKELKQYLLGDKEQPAVHSGFDHLY